MSRGAGWPQRISLNSDAERSDASLLGFDVLSDLVTSLISNPENETPFVIGIHGPWGSGKSTLMRTVRKKLDGADGRRTQTVWFNAWKHSNEEALLAALFVEVIRQIEGNSFQDKLETLALKYKVKWPVVGGWISRWLTAKTVDLSELIEKSVTTRLRSGDKPRPSSCKRYLGGCQGILLVEEQTRRKGLSLADGGGVGEGGPRHRRPDLALGQRMGSVGQHGTPSGQHPRIWYRFDDSRQELPARQEPLRTLRHGRKRLAVDGRLLAGEFIQRRSGQQEVRNRQGRCLVRSYGRSTL